jgi:hypothetical protein
MAKASMVTTEELIEHGSALLDVLKIGGIEVSAAVWSQSPLFQEWRLQLVLPLVEKVGILKAHEQVGRVIQRARGLSMSDLSLFTPESSYAKRLRASLKGQRNTYLRHFAIDNDDTFIEDGYVYFVK